MASRGSTANRIFVFTALGLLLTDFVYKTVNGITIQNREACILYRNVPRDVFYFYEYFLELFLIMTGGIVFAVILETYFERLNRYVPKGKIGAFLVASVIPVCSCGVIPLVETMRDKMRFGTIMTFVIAAPLLNPYIIVLSFSVLGVKYGILRIVFSALLAISGGFLMQWLYAYSITGKSTLLPPCKTKVCHVNAGDVFQKTVRLTKKILPYFLIAATLGFLVERFPPSVYLSEINLNHPVWSVLISSTIGIPVYFCNGAEVLFLKPLVVFSGIPMGTAISFSLTSTAICITTIVMLGRFIGWRLTTVLTLYVLVFTTIVGIVMNMLVGGM
ncbi:MAG: permease [Bacteroidetes bacterium]|nr:permease [Bacteroidota bacterium]MBU1719152.1 permease [Bacteroidota bacterium]